jgi:hypothetical protein
VSNGASGAGGGRVAVTATERLDLYDAASEIQAHGGRNNAGEGASQLDGGAGTVFLARPGATAGELRVSALDDRYPSSTHLTRSTPISSANGTLTFDTMTVGPRALVRLDNALTLTTPQSVDATATVIAPTDLPVLTMTTTPASGTSVIQGTSIAAAVDATSPAGISQISFVFSAGSASPLTFPSWPAHATNSATIAIPAAATPGTATLKAVTTDRAGRSVETTVASFTVVANNAPAITAFDVTPAPPVYIGATLSAAIGATDDVAVKTLSLTSQIGSGAASTQSFTANAPSASHTFTVAIPRDATLDGQTVTLTAKADDGTAAPTSQTKTVTIAHDGTAPVVTITQPNASTQAYIVGSGVKIHVVATAVDAQSGLASITASIEGGQSGVRMNPTANANEYAADLDIPFVGGSATVTRNVTVTATDYLGNASKPTAPASITPLYDPTAPVVTWNCGSDGAMVPVGGTLTLTVTAVPGANGSAVHEVQFSDGTNTYIATANGAVYTYNYTVPSGLTDGSVITITATATTNGQSTGVQQASVTVVAPQKTISANTTINDGDLTYDFQTVAITGGTTTIVGHHEFTRLLVMNGATLVQKPVDVGGTHPLDIKTGALFVACGGAIDVSGQGYPVKTTYPFAAVTADVSGSHIGLGLVNNGSTPVAGLPTYGSVDRPQEPGGGGSTDSGANGGGVIRVDASSLVVDGAIRANGTYSGSKRGAGGSIWITGGKISGAGSIEATGNTDGPYGPGAGGGAIAIEYSDFSSALPSLHARGGWSGQGYYAGAGSIWIKGPSSTYGELTINNEGHAGQATQLPSLGSGVAQSGSAGATLVTDLVANIPAYFAGHWVEIADPATGTLKGTWRIATVSNKTVTLAPNGTETINVAAGDAWQGVYRFDTLHSAHGEPLQSVDPIRLGANGALTLAGPTDGTLTLSTPIDAATVTLSGNVAAPSVNATTMTVTSGTLSPLVTTPASTLTINVSGTLTVASSGAIDASGAGTIGVDVSATQTGGSHIGYGVRYDNNTAGPATFGSVTHPQEAGGAANREGANGGGIVRITAGVLQVDGAIRANGVDLESRSARGAGGSIWITTGKISGSGSIEASSLRGGPYGPGGGGGAVAVEYSDPASVVPALWARGGKSDQGYIGGAGSTFVKSASSVFGALTVNDDGLHGQATELPSLGYGTAQSGSSGAALVTDRAATIPAYFASHWVEVTDPSTNTVKGLWRIATINNKSVTLTPNGSETINVQPGDIWRGVYRFDSVTVHGATLQSGDRIDGTATADNGGKVVFNPAAPLFDAAKVAQIRIVPTTPGHANIVAPAGTVTDSNTPINLVVTNKTTSATFLGTVDATGAFTVAVTGASGDPFAIVATDTHAFPLSASIVVSNWPASASIASVDVSPSPVTGTYAATGTVTLAAAVTYDATITLSSSASATASVPASILIPAGQTSGTFPVTVVNPPADVTVTITATTGTSQQTASLPVKALVVALQLAPTSVAGGTASTGTVTLSAAAVNATTINLSSSSNTATVPATLTIAAGQTSATFTVSTTPTPSDVTATITAGYGQSQATATLTVQAPQVSAITASPATVYGGAPLTVTVQLSSPASAGTAVALSSSNAAVPLPASVSIPVGATTATFNVTTTSVAAQTSVTLTATFHTTSQSTTVSVIHDATAPTVTITAPNAGHTYTSGNTFTVSATIVDAEVGVKQASASIDGVSVAMTRDQVATNVWNATVTAPAVDGTATQPKTITVTASDYENNSRSATLAINVQPVIDPTAPTVSWTCNAGGAIYPIGAVAKLQVVATAATGDSIQGVSVTITTPSGTTTQTMTSLGNNVYSYDYTIPSVTADTVITARAVATTFGNKSAGYSTSITALAPASTTVTYSANATIQASDTANDATKTVVVTAGTLTILGHHSFNRLIVVGGNVVSDTTVQASTLDVTASTIFIACGASIDNSGNGYGANKSYPGASTPGDATGGSHMGLGGVWSGPQGSAFGSVYMPQEAGGGGGNAGWGGGIVRLQSPSGWIVVDGTLASKGQNAGSDRTGAGGSIWITTGKISGAGKIDVGSNNAYYGSGGGGAVAIEYTDSTSTIPTMAMSAGTSSQGRLGGAGTFYVKGPSSVYGDLTLDNAGINGQATVLSSLGSGTAQTGTSGNTLVTDRASNIPAYFAGNWVQITRGGAVVGTWRIATINAKTVTLTPNGSETISLNVGDAWAGVYQFDNVRVLNGAKLLSSDALLTSSALNVTGPADLQSPITVPTVTISGAVTAVQINATDVTVNSGATLTQGATDGLRLNVTGTLNVIGSIDVTGHGYGSNSSYPGATTPGDASGGSHIGLGGVWSGPQATTFGSIYRPMEAGGGGGNGSAPGGGVVRIVAGNVVVSGSINARGSSGDRSGAGGSVWITATKITGTGRIDVGSNGVYYGSGGGGAIAVEYTDPTSTLPVMATVAGTSSQGRVGGGGSVYVKGPSNTYGDLTVDNGGVFAQATVLPSLGNGIAQTGTSGNTLITDRSVNIPAYFAGNWVQITRGSAVLGAWRIATINAKTVTLTPNGSETISLAAGDLWQGVYKFDTLTLRGVRLESGADLVQSTTEVIASGTVEHEQINAANLDVKPGALLTHRQGLSLSITTTNETRVEATGLIDVNGRGYPNNTSYPGATTPGDATGGSHMGLGGVWSGPQGSAYGSVYRPQEAGGGGGNGGSNGGGIIRIQAGSGAVIVDGTIRARNWNGDRSGAGGSIWISTAKISGAGKLDVGTDGVYYGSGGGGAIAVEYTDPTSTVPAVVLGAGTSSQGRLGGAGTLYVKGPSSTYGDLTADNGGISGQATVLAALGSGTAQAGTSGNTLVTDRASNIPAYFAGNWVQITRGGAVVGTWRIATINTKTVTLTPNGSESISLNVGDAWAGVYQFDNVRVVNGAKLISGDTIITATALNVTGPADLQSPISAPTVTISGAVTAVEIDATTLTVNSGATLTQGSTDALRLNVTGTLNVIGSINVDGHGYGSNASYPGATTPGDATGGSHMGLGGVWSNPQPSTFGSVYRPMESGGGAGNGGAGGGVVRIQAANVVVSGTIYARGAATDRSGAGGSIWITAGKISGTGRIDVGSYNIYYGAGGGGAIAIEYTDPTSTLPVIATASGTSSQGRVGGGGTFYLKGPSSVYGDLTVDNGGQYAQATVLPSLGNGIAQTGTSGNTLVTDRAVNIPAYFAGNWVQVTRGSVVLGTWRIATVSNKTVTLTPNGAETIALAQGDLWQGVYQFDAVHVNNGGRLNSTDPLLPTTALTTQGTVEMQSPITTATTTIGGNVTAVQINTTDLTVNSGATLTQGSTDALRLNVSGTLNVIGSINVDGHGYGSNASYPGATTPGDATGGSHMGLGGVWSNPQPSTFGSVYRPMEAGGGAGNGGAGGGVVRIQAANVVVSGTIYARGAATDRSGAGGSIWITTGKISGTGRIDVGSYNIYYGAGGGGAIAIEYTDPTSTIPTTAMATGTSNQGRLGGGGTFYLKGPSSVYGDLTVDNGGQYAQATVLPSLGNGIAQTGTSGNTLVTDRAVNIPAYFAGNWVQVTRGSAVLGTWRIATVSNKTVTLTPNGAETISLAQGDLWQGVYQFDSIHVNNGGRLNSADTLLTTTAVTTQGTVEMQSPVTTATTTIGGNATAVQINTTDLTVTSGGVLTQGGTDALRLNVTGTLNVIGSIDVTGHGYGSNASYPGATTPGDATGGSHMGLGGVWSNPQPSTFGSVYRPMESGGGAGNGGAGGGVIRIQASNVVVSGSINARGAVTDRSGAGGSIWITTGKISGTGRIDVGSNNAYYGAGGGGAIAIEYTDPTSTVPTTAMATGTSNQGRLGGAGTAWVKGPSNTYGDLTVNNNNINGQPTSLPSLGNGTAQTGTSGNILVTDRAANIPAYFAGHYVEITRAGALIGTWRIGTVTANSKTVTLTPNGTETISLQAGDLWQGVYRFDTKTVGGGASLTSTDPIRLGPTGTSQPIAVPLQVPSDAAKQAPKPGDARPGQGSDSLLMPPVVAALQLASPTAREGETVSAVILLTAPAPRGGVTVALTSSDDAAVHLPDSVIVPEGAISTSFVVTVSCDGRKKDDVTITATSGTAATANLTIAGCQTNPNGKNR